MAAGPFGENHQHFLATNHTVTANVSNEDLTATSQEFSTNNMQNATLAIYALGDGAGFAGDITLAYQVSIDAVNWVDRPTIAVTIAGATVSEDADAITNIDLRGVDYIRLKDVTNSDADDTATLNVALNNTRR